jgi:hypothetical protein
VARREYSAYMVAMHSRRLLVLVPGVAPAKVVGIVAWWHTSICLRSEWVASWALCAAITGTCCVSSRAA